MVEPRQISASEAAKKWGVSARLVQRLCAQGRVAGAIRVGRNWVLPANTKKPQDLREGSKAHSGSHKKKKKSANPQSPKTNKEQTLSANLQTLVSKPAPAFLGDSPDSLISSASSSHSKLYYETALLYLRGNFEQVIEQYLASREDEATTCRLMLFAVGASIGSGRFDVYEEIVAFCEEKAATYQDDTLKKIIDISLSNAMVNAFISNKASEWIKNGDYSGVPASLLPGAVQLRAKYLLTIGQSKRALGTAETALALCPAHEGITFPSIYLRLTIATAHIWLMSPDKARPWIEEAVNMCLPHGLIAPLAEALADCQGLIEGYIKQHFPSYLKNVTELSERVLTNWTSFHNLFAGEDLTQKLSIREIQIARLVASRVPYATIAGQIGVSVGSINNTVQSIYSKLDINSRKELADYVIPKSMGFDT